MNETDIQIIKKKGIPIPSLFQADRYILVQGESMAEILGKTIEAVRNGKKPVVIIDERFQKSTRIEEQRAFHSENQLNLRKLDMISGHIIIFKESVKAPHEYKLYIPFANINKGGEQ